MPRLTFSATLLALAGSTLVLAQPESAVPFLARARQALGGDAVLSAVATWTVSGSQSRDIGPAITQSGLDVSCVLPDKFIQVFHQTFSMGPMGMSEITRTEGFNGDDAIHETVAPDAPFPVEIRGGPVPTTPAEIAAARTKQTNAQKHAFAELTLPLFAASFAGYPLDFTVAGSVSLPTGAADVIEGQGPDGWRVRLFLDSSTHLPVKISWMDKPLVTFSTSSSVAVRVNSLGQATGSPTGLGSAPVPPPGDPTAGLADVDWVTTIGDYRIADGLNWPHRFTTTYAGKKFEDTRLAKFKINPNINPKLFKPSK